MQIGHLIAEMSDDHVIADAPLQTKSNARKQEDVVAPLEPEGDEISPADVETDVRGEETENSFAAGVKGDHTMPASARPPRGSEEPGDELIRPEDLARPSYKGNDCEDPPVEKGVRKGFAENNAAAAAASIGHVRSILCQEFCCCDPS